MEVRPGYKRTEIGVIPEDWRVGKLDDLNPFVTSGSRGWAKYYAEYGSAFIRMTNLSRDSIYLDLDDLKVVDLPSSDKEGSRTQLQDGDLLISITADVGIIGYVDSSVPKPAYINQHIALVRFDADRANRKFLGYFLASNTAQGVFRSATDQGAKTGMNLAGIRAIQVVFPPLPEQHAIAKALSDMDALIAALDRLIAKKHAIKQGAMQQVLTGKTRLPGFSGEWEMKMLGDVFDVTAGGDFDASQSSIIQDEVHRYPIYSNAISNSGLHGFCSYNDHRAGAITVTARGTLGVANYRDHDFTAIGRVLVLNPKMPLDGRFFSEFINGRIDFAVESTGVPQLTAPQISKYELSVPPLPEQRAIAAVLSDMDAEIAALEAHRDKTRALKQGMMQELLTGKTRLI